MLNKKNNKNWIKKTILFILTLSLFSCSTIGKLWYERLDIYLANYFFEYTDFTNKQSNNIRKVTKDFKEWNSRFELPKYKNFLNEIIKLNRRSVLGMLRKSLMNLMNYLSPTMLFLFLI